MQVATAAGETVFASSEGLYEGVYTFDSYTGPLLGALTPFIWAFAAHRGCGVVLYSLGCTLVGTASDASEMLQLLSQPGPEERVKRPELSTTAATQAIEWWTQRLNTMFGILTDPAVFTDSHGLYQPAKHLRALLTIEQLFRRVYSIQTTHRDASARRVLLFTVLDTLHSLTNHALVKNCDPDFAKETLEWLRLQIPGPAAEILLPAAERAVAALERIRDGFFLGVTPDGNRIRLMHPQGDAEEITLSQASARYVELLRNATHGHGTIKANQVDNINALLAQHRGHLPHDLALVGYLYLLEALTRPDILRKNLYRNGKA
ncbi:MAG TPA: hypothetical protein VHW44_29015 [Pseudonocardiaceae bacterium]|nr:hypothetical protein [Pseudonocardiaceae bacterium]